MKKQLATLFICAALTHTSSSLAMQKLPNEELQWLTASIEVQQKRIAMEQAILAEKMQKVEAHRQHMEWEKRRQLSHLELLALSTTELEKNVIEAEQKLTKADRKIAQKKRVYKELKLQLVDGRAQLEEEQQEALQKQIWLEKTEHGQTE